MKYPIPEEVFDNHVAFVGKTGSGKTVAAKGAAERLLDKGKRICAVDPTGVWWGLKSKYPVVVFGGRKADLPLNAAHGTILAEVIGTTSMNAVLDTSLMTVGERTRFFKEFAETLLRKNESPLHLFLDEAHVFAPQGKVPDPQAGQMLHAANNLVSLGRSRGLRIVLITQRPAKLHKDSLTQVETMVAMRVIAPQDKAAVNDWMGEWDAAGKSKEIMASLPKLQTGEAWLYSPEANILKPVEFPMIKTFDSSSAPKDGKQAKVQMVEVDLAALGEKLNKAGADILADDPRTLKRRIHEQEQEIKKLKAAPAVQAGPSKEELSQMQQEAHSDGVMQGRVEGFKEAMRLVVEAVNGVGLPVAFGVPAKVSNLSRTVSQETANRQHRQRLAQERPAAPAPEYNGEKLGQCEQKILNVLGQFDQGRTKNQIAMLSGYSSTSGGFNNSLSKLRTKGLIEGAPIIRATPDGKALAEYEPLPTGPGLLAHWVNKVGQCGGKILEVLHATGGLGMSKDDIAAAAGYSPTSGGFNNSLSKLRTLELIEGRNPIHISQDFFQ